MACYKPVTAWKPLEGGVILFSEKKGCREIQIACGQCIGCRIRKREEWAVRIFAESKMHEKNVFCTFTYNDDHVPDDYSLHYRHMQLLHYRMRQKYGAFRFFTVGEYGDEKFRPHYHSIYFGLDFDDKRKSNSLYSRFDLYESESLNECWGKGKVAIGEVTYESSRYCAVYTTKRIGGDLAESHYLRVSPVTGEYVNVQPEFAKMSLKPGIGQAWLEKYYKDVYVSGADGVVVNGSKKPIPKFFDKKLEDIAPILLEDFKHKKFKEAMRHPEEFTRARLEVKEKCAKAREKFNTEKRA